MQKPMRFDYKTRRLVPVEEQKPKAKAKQAKNKAKKVENK